MRKKIESTKEYSALIKEIKANIDGDRGAANALLVKLMEILIHNPRENEDLGLTAAKYLEVLQKSNEQLVKLAVMMRKETLINNSLTSEDKENIFDVFQNDVNGDKEDKEE